MSAHLAPSLNKLRVGYRPGRVFGGRGGGAGAEIAPGLGGLVGCCMAILAGSQQPGGRGSASPASIQQNQALSRARLGSVARVAVARRQKVQQDQGAAGQRRLIDNLRTGTGSARLAHRGPGSWAAAAPTPDGGGAPLSAAAAVTHAGRARQTQPWAKTGASPAPSALASMGTAKPGARFISRRGMGSGVGAAHKREASAAESGAQETGVRGAVGNRVWVGVAVHRAFDPGGVWTLGRGRG